MLEIEDEQSRELCGNAHQGRRGEVKKKNRTNAIEDKSSKTRTKGCSRAIRKKEVRRKYVFTYVTLEGYLKNP